MYPHIRLRRNRKTLWLRDTLAEFNITTNDLVWPIFIVEGKAQRQNITTMPSVERLSIDEAVKDIKMAYELGIKAIALFPVTNAELKSPMGDYAYLDDNLICRAIRAIKDLKLDIGIICDVALDPYTSHGHDGILDDFGDVDNDLTIEALAKQALTIAKAGVDVVAPSDMMDGRVRVIRTALDEHDYAHVNILSYSVKYRSHFYGPFRTALNNKAVLDKSTYQLNYRNAKEAMREIEHDIDEGADMIMIKPGLPYLDIIKTASQRFDIPIFAYQVSGEYACLKFAAMNGAINYDNALMESLIAFKRAGTSAIFTYSAIDAARLIKSQQ